MSSKAGSIPAAYWELTKPRLSFLSVLTALTGYFCSNPHPQGGVDPKALVSLALGTALAAGGCGALNMWMERQADSQMDRTRFRPLPSGLIKPSHALIFGISLSSVGVGLVWNGANTLAGLLTLATVVSYLLFYTPLKTKTTWCTLVGSLPGAIPPIIGTATKLGVIDTMGWLLFALLFFWQVPHFMSLAVMCRNDYERGGFKIATVADPSGRTAALWSISFMVPLLFVVSAIAQLYFITDPTRGWMSPFIWVSLIASIIFFKLSLDFMLPQRRSEVAKPFFLASILYLPVILLTLTLNRLF